MQNSSQHRCFKAARCLNAQSKVCVINKHIHGYNTCRYTHTHLEEKKKSLTGCGVSWLRENGSGGQPAELPPEVSAVPGWLDPAAQSHTVTHTHTQDEIERHAYSHSKTSK